MRLVPSLFLGLLVLPVYAAQQPSAASPSLLTEVTRAGAQAEALAVFCTGQNRSALQTNAAALAGWRERNRWSTVRAFWASDPTLEPTYNSERGAALAELKQHPFKAAFTCGVLPNVLRSEKFDPSMKHRAELAQLTPPANAASTSPETNGIGVPSTPPASARSTQVPVGSSSATPPQSAAATGPSPDPSSAMQAQPPAATPGQQITAGEATFTIPPGWRVTKSTPDLALLAFDKPGDGRTLLVITAAPLAGDLRQAFLASVRSQFPGTGLTLKYPHDALTPTGLPAVTVGDSGHLNNARHSSAAVTAVGVATGGRLQTALMLSSTTIGEQITRKKDLERLVGTWQLRTPGPQPAWNPLRPPAPGAALSGLWFGSRIMNQLNPLGGMDLIAVREYVVLFPDGRAFQELPEGGHVLDMNYTAACNKRPKACGTYTLHGSSLTFHWAGDYGFLNVDATQLKQSNNGASFFEHDGASVVQVAPVHNLRLSGNYTSTFAMAGSTAAGSNSVVSQTFIRFAPDGAFQKSGFSSASFSNSGAAGTVGGNRGVESGRYTIEGYTLTLEPVGQSAPELYTVVFEDPSPMTKAVFINDKAFLR